VSKNVALLVLNRGATSSPEGSNPDQNAKAEEGQHKEQRKNDENPSISEADKYIHTA
jgi:hypothetical protein